jgi:lipoic acid synthetase
MTDAPVRRHPDWIRSRIPSGDGYRDLKQLVRGLSLNTVCEEAICPNLGECWDQRTATIMILGDVCTRACGFCAVETGRPTWHDPGEPLRVAQAVRHMGLEHVVVTSVARDDLPDGGAGVFAATIREIRRLAPTTGVEVLIPDFDGREAPLRAVMDAAPDILDHNVETVERLQRPVRKRARYDRSLQVLARAKAMAGASGAAVHTKSSVMVGLGETRDELSRTFGDLRAVGCDILTIGQYLRPTPAHLPVERYWHPDEFAELRDEARALGFLHVESGPLVRTSYHARDQVPDATRRAVERAVAARLAGEGSADRAHPGTRVLPVATVDAEGRVVPSATAE